MDDVTTLIADAMNAIKLKVLVFGPQVHTPSPQERTAKLQGKRMEIRQRLEELGHHVRYAEDLVDPAIAGAGGNVFFQEIVIMGEYDYIVTIVDSPGSIAEATVISLNPLLARKASLFLDQEYQVGLVASTCENARDIGAHFALYTYPVDLDDCHLLTKVVDRVTTIQKIKYLL
jgi:hypothetical protein